eukprot:g270.t1
MKGFRAPQRSAGLEMSDEEKAFMVRTGMAISEQNLGNARAWLAKYGSRSEDLERELARCGFGENALASATTTTDSAFKGYVHKVVIEGHERCEGSEPLHTTYTIVVRVKPAEREPGSKGAGGPVFEQKNHLPEYRVKHRYREFRRLHDELARSEQIPQCDTRWRFRSMSDKNVARRTEALGTFLRECANSPQIAWKEAFRRFLRVGFWQRNQRLRHTRPPAPRDAKVDDVADLSGAAHTVSRFVRAVVERDEQLERIAALFRRKLVQFASLLMQGFEVLKFPRLPAGNPRVRVLWMHPDGMLCLSKDKQPRHTVKCILLEHITGVGTGSSPRPFQLSPRLQQEVQGPGCAAQCVSIYGRAKHHEAFHFRMPSRASAQLLVRKLLDITSEIGRAPAGAARRAQAVHFARHGQLLPQHTAMRIAALCADSGGLVAFDKTVADEFQAMAKDAVAA